MKNHIFNRKIIRLAVILCAVLTLFVTSTVYADMGPGISTTVYFYGLPEDEVCVTLLSSTLSTGPYHAWTGNQDYTKKEPPAGQEKAWEKFYSYRDPDGYMFLQYAQMVREGEAFKWGSSSPKKFKVLVYLPDSDRLLVSEDILDTYSVHSVYRVDLSQESGGKFKSSQEYRVTEEVLSFVVRLVLTLSIELALAWLLGYRTKKQLLIITAANVVTQILLNVYMFFIGAQVRPLRFEESFGLRSYLLVELAVTVIEAVVYAFTLDEKKKREMAVWYALIANAASFFIGIGLSRIVPFAF